jgi:hypothetical protein
MVPGVVIGCNRELAKITHATQACENMHITITYTNTRTYTRKHRRDARTKRPTDGHRQTQTRGYTGMHARTHLRTQTCRQIDRQSTCHVFVVHKPDEHRQLRMRTQAMQLIKRTKHLESPSGLPRGSSMPSEVLYRSCCSVFIEGEGCYGTQANRPATKNHPCSLNGCKPVKMQVVSSTRGIRGESAHTHTQTHVASVHTHAYAHTHTHESAATSTVRLRRGSGPDS